jgi:hypothetical protein
MKTTDLQQVTDKLYHENYQPSDFLEVGGFHDNVYQ